MDDSPVNEVKEAEHILEFADLEHGQEMMGHLSHLYTCGRFCDATLVVGEHEIAIHRAVLASASGFFHDMFFRAEEAGLNQTMFKVKDVDWASFDHVLKFIYTGRLSVPESEIRAVYNITTRLRLDAAARACAQHLVTCLTPDNCLGVRLFAADDHFRQQVDNYVYNNVVEVTNCKEFFNLPRIGVEIVVADEKIVHEEISHMLPLVMNWVRNQMAMAKITIDRLAEDEKVKTVDFPETIAVSDLKGRSRHLIEFMKVNVLYLNTDNTLTDCMEVENTELKENDIVQDYKKLTKKKQSGQVKPRDSHSSPELTNHNGVHPFRKFNLNPETPTPEVEWSIIGSHQMKDHTYVSIVVIRGTLASISIHYSPVVDTAGSGPDSPVHSSPPDRYSSLVPLEPMQMKRCAFGLKVLNNKLFACGGYDRGECMKSTEQYSFQENTWTDLAEMRTPRGRCSIAEYDGKIYACGGSDGHREIKMVEVYDGQDDRWSFETDCPAAKASPGIVIQNDLLYVIGGSMGQKTVSDCESYNLRNKTWRSVGKLNIPRFQVAVCCFEKQIWAVGGTNGWKCLTDTELYDTERNVWVPGPPLNIARRGPGIAEYNGTIYVVGGNDGTSALNSTEIYDRKTGSWVLGPMLSVPRANVGVAVLENKLFAVGGFNGKKFLDTLEYLDIGHTDEWCSYLPMEYEKRKSSTDDIGSGDQNISDGTVGSCGKQRVNNENETNGTEISKNKSSGNVNDLKSLKSLQAESNGVSCNGGINGHTEEERNS